jgi:hypothetical protein
VEWLRLSVKLDNRRFVIQSQPMEPQSAAEHLQVIRTLMERTAVYRRALKPIMFWAGGMGTAGGIAGHLAGIGPGRKFVLFWTLVAVTTLLGTFFLARRQALKDAEPFWSPPAQRVTQAFLPPLFAGFVVSLAALALRPGQSATLVLVELWVMLYGCALHAAGFFMPRGIKLLGWCFLMAGAVALRASFNIERPVVQHPGEGHLLMALMFGGGHLGYGIYLCFTEPPKNEM